MQAALYTRRSHGGIRAWAGVWTLQRPTSRLTKSDGNVAHGDWHCNRAGCCKKLQVCCCVASLLERQHGNGSKRGNLCIL